MTSLITQIQNIKHIAKAAPYIATAIGVSLSFCIERISNTLKVTDYRESKSIQETLNIFSERTKITIPGYEDDFKRYQVMSIQLDKMINMNRNPEKIAKFIKKEKSIQNSIFQSISGMSIGEIAKGIMAITLLGGIINIIIGGPYRFLINLIWFFMLGLICLYIYFNYNLVYSLLCKYFKKVYQDASKIFNNLGRSKKIVILLISFTLITCVILKILYP